MSQRERGYRPIQPAWSLQPGRDVSTTTSNPIAPKKRPVFRACYDCRKAKIKCDGFRPKCGPCDAKDRSCGYDTDEPAPARPAGPPAQATSSESRVQALEMLIDVLQKSPSDQAARLLRRIRTSDNPVAMLDALGEVSASVTSRPTPTSNPMTASVDVPHTANDQLERWLRSQDPSDYSSIPAVSSTSDSVMSDPDTTPPTSKTSGLPDDVDMAGCPPLPMDGGVVANPLLSVFQHAVPGAAITRESLDVFFVCSGRLLHVFSREQGAELFRAVYGGGELRADASAEDIGCLMAIASVGAQYTCGSFGNDVEEAYYTISKHCLDTIIELKPLDAVKVCSLLAIYNVMTKATVSLAYVEIGLGLCRRCGLNDSSSPHPNLSDASWIDYRKAWRTLMFLSSWLSTTLGYVSGNDFQCDKVSLAELEVERPRSTSDVVQIEISKICVLKADILRVHLAANEITAPALQSIAQDLHNWYIELPLEMRLDCTGREDLDLETKRSISHIHLHYLGALMLLYSRVTSQFMQPSGEWEQMPSALRALLDKVAGEAVVAARTSCRVLWLLYEEHSIFKRCWLVIFQAYTCCLILLHSAAQKQLHNFPMASLYEDVESIKDSLSILYYCGALDKVAASFHKKLTAALNEILAKGESMRAGTSGAEMPPAGSFAYLMTVPERADAAHVNLSMTLLAMLCRPYGHPSSVIIGPAEEESHLEEVVPRTRTWSRWGVDNHCFQWDMEGLLSGEGGQAEQASCGRFLGSLEPNGWINSAPIRQTVR